MIAKGNATVAGLVDEYITRRVDVKRSTREHFQRCGRDLVGFLGADTPLEAVTPADADDFRAAMRSKTAENTTRRTCSRAKQFFRYAVRKRLIAESPFADMRGLHVRGNRAREFYVSEELALRVLDKLPDTEWQAIFVLSRWGGLRCPSEHLALQWSDVNWLDKRLRVPSPKTEHHEGKAFRVIPLFPEVAQLLAQAVLGAKQAHQRLRDSQAART